MTENVRQDVLDDVESAAVVAAALALIDDVYSTTTSKLSEAARSFRRRRRVHEELNERRVQVAELEQRLKALLAHQHGPLDGSCRSALWAQVARNQRDQLVNISWENTLLRECVRTQRTLAQELLLRSATTLLESSCGQFPSTIPLTRQICMESVPLATRLDAIVARASPDWLGMFPSIDSVFGDRHAQVRSTGDGLVVQFRSASFMPFKLSLIVTELWDVILHDSYGTAPPYRFQDHSPDEAFAQSVMRLRAPRLEVVGPTGLRRTLTPDGSVVFAAASIGAAPASLASPAMGGLEFHEMSWMRVGRVPTAPSLVYVESFCHLDIKPASDARWYEGQFHHVRDLCYSNQLRGPTNSQKLENRLIDLMNQQRH